MARRLPRRGQVVAFVSGFLMLLAYMLFGVLFFDLTGDVFGTSVGSACASDVVFALFLLTAFPEFMSSNIVRLGPSRHACPLRALLAVVGCVAVWFVGILMSTWVLNNVSDPAYSAAYTGSAPMWQTLLLGLFAAPLCEEMLVRGYILGRLREDVSPVVAGLVSATFFAAMHGTLVHIPLTFALGLFLALLRIRGASIVACMAMHSLSNALSLFVAPRVNVPPYLVAAPFAQVVWFVCAAGLVFLLVRERVLSGE